MNPVHGLRVSTASKHDGCINMASAQYSLTLPADTSVLLLGVYDYVNKTKNPKVRKKQTNSAKLHVCSEFGWSILYVWSSRGRAAVSASPAPAAACSQRLFTPSSSSLPSSSPMRSSFQVQQSSINLIHSPTLSSGREPAAYGRQITGVRPPPQPARRSCCCALVAPCGGPHSFFLLLPARFCGASFKRAADQWSFWAGERKTRTGQPGTLPT